MKTCTIYPVCTTPKVHERHCYVILEGFRSECIVNLMLDILHQIFGNLVAPLYPHMVSGNPSLN